MNSTNSTATIPVVVANTTPFNIISLSDFTAAITGYVFSEINGTPGAKQATQSFFVSLVARAITEGGYFTMFSKLNNSQKNQIIVAILSAAAAKMRNKSVSKNLIMGARREY